MTNSLVKTIIVVVCGLAILSVGVLIGSYINASTNSSMKDNILATTTEDINTHSTLSQDEDDTITNAQAMEQLYEAVIIAEKYWNEPDNKEENMANMNMICTMYGGVEANMWNDYCAKAYRLWKEMAYPQINDTPMKTIAEAKRMLINQ